MHDPTLLRNMVEGILGFQPSWTDLYGVNDPFSLSENERKIEFSRFVAGHGNDEQT